MQSSKIPGGVAHTLPADFSKTLTESPAALTAWMSLTPLARNEWICWIISFKKQETRDNHITRAIEDLTQGKRRPCCWPGCPHRT